MDFVFHKKQPPTRQHLKRELYKLLIARSDISQSSRACKLMLNTVKGLGDDLYMPLFSAIVVCYCRPFTENEPFGSIGKKWRKFASPEHKSTHNKILKARHELIAHSDMRIKEAFIVPPGFEMHWKGAPEKKLSSPKIGVQTSLYMFQKPFFEKAQLLSHFQQKRIGKVIDNLTDKLYGGMELPNAPFKIKIDDGL